MRSSALHEQIFGEGAGLQLKRHARTQCVHALHTEQTDLPVPVAGVGVALNAVLPGQIGREDFIFLNAADVADADCLNGGHSFVSVSCCFLQFP